MLPLYLADGPRAPAARVKRSRASASRSGVALLRDLPQTATRTDLLDHLVEIMLRASGAQAI